MNVSGREEVLLGAFRFVRRNMLGGDYLVNSACTGGTRSIWLMHSRSTCPSPYKVGRQRTGGPDAQNEVFRLR
jgi:hypothetical protein